MKRESRARAVPWASCTAIASVRRLRSSKLSEPGDVVAVKLYNRVELVIALGAAWRLRAAVTPINPGFTAEETNYQLSDSAAKVVLAERPEPGLMAPVLPLSDIVTATVQILPEPGLRGDDRALLVYTSGSTGKPKGVMLDHANCEAMSRMFAEHFRLTVRDHCLLVLPLFHVNAIMISTLAPLRVGGRLTVLPRFSASGFFTDFERIRPTYFSAVPAMYASLPAEIAPDTSSLRFAVCGAAPASRNSLKPPSAASVSPSSKATDSPRAPAVRPATRWTGYESRGRSALHSRGSASRSWTTRDRSCRPGRPERSSSAGPLSCAVTLAARSLQRKPSSTAGSTPETSASSTRTATCESSTASRT